MSVLPQASLFLGIIPALFFLYLSLSGYEKYYKDKTIFIIFITGIILGFIAAFVQFYFYAISIISLILLAFFDQLIKTIILNLRRFQGKKETPIYGLAMGLGFGSSFTPFMMLAASKSQEIPDNTFIISLIALGTMGLILFHGATGAYIGFGVFSGKLFKKLLISIILEIPLSFFVILTFISDVSNIYIQASFVALSIIYGLIIFLYVTRKILPKIKKRKRSNS